MDRCDIIIPVWNQLGVTKACIDSIVKHTDYPYRLIIIDNGSDPETREYLDGLKGEKYLGLLLIHNEKNLGFVKAVNQGLRISDAQYICIMNNDTIATDGWLEEMIEVMSSDPRIGILNPSSNTSNQSPDRGEPIDDYASGLKRFKLQVQELSVCRGFCMLMRREVLEKVGLFDESFNIGYFEETDYCKRARREGYMLSRAKASYVYHNESSTFRTLEEREKLFKDNEKLYFNKWGRPVRLAYLVDRPSSGSNIDDIAVNAARSGHQITVFIKKGLSWPVGTDHFDIRRADVNPVFFGSASVLKILKRRRKKKLEVLLTDNALFGYFLKLIGAFHGARVLVNPGKDEVLKILKEKSAQF